MRINGKIEAIAPATLAALLAARGIDPALRHLAVPSEALRFGLYGRDTTGRMVIYFTESLILEEDVTVKDNPRNFQIVEKFKAKRVR